MSRARPVRFRFATAIWRHLEDRFVDSSPARMAEAGIRSPADGHDAGDLVAVLQARVRLMAAPSE